MKLTRGTYEGASLFAQFDKPVSEMEPDEAKALLNFILHQAMPGMDNHESVYHALEVAEQCAREQGVAI